MAPASGIAKVRFEQRRLVLREERHALAVPHAQVFQDVREAIDALQELRISAAVLAVDDGELLAEDRGRPLQEVDRTEASQVERGRRLSQHGPIPSHLQGRKLSQALSCPDRRSSRFAASSAT